MIRANYYGKTIDERSTNDPIGSEVLIDVELGMDINEHFTLMVGANNLLDEYPDMVPGRVSQGMPYPRRSPIGSHGGMAYVRGVYKF